MVFTAIAAILALIGTLVSLIWNSRSQFYLNRFNSELRRLEEERKVLFSSLHAKRIEITSELYTLLARMDIAYQNASARYYSEGEPNTEGRMVEAHNAAVKCFHYFQENRIWLDEAVVKIIDEVLENFKAAGIHQRMYLQLPPGEAKAGQWDKMQDVVMDKVPAVRRQLDAEFRQMLGSSGEGESKKIKA